jgi:hypothetical protein
LLVAGGCAYYAKLRAKEDEGRRWALGDGDWRHGNDDDDDAFTMDFGSSDKGGRGESGGVRSPSSKRLTDSVERGGSGNGGGGGGAFGAFGGVELGAIKSSAKQQQAGQGARRQVAKQPSPSSLGSDRPAAYSDASAGSVNPLAHQATGDFGGFGSAFFDRAAYASAPARGARGGGCGGGGVEKRGTPRASSKGTPRSSASPPAITPPPSGSAGGPTEMI